MKKRHPSRNRLAILVLWFCLASLVALPISNGISPSALRFYEIDLQDSDPFDQTDTDDDLLVLFIEGLATTGLGSSKPQTINLDFPSAFLPPDSPPPKYS